MPELTIISPDDLVDMARHGADAPLRVHVDYAHADNTLFGERIYRADARLWLYRLLADVVVKAAALCFARHGARFILYDGLRTVEAQEAMLHMQRVKDNPHWLEEPRLLSPPGAGGHPRGMAIDIGLEDAQGRLLDMGTVFDYLAEDSSPAVNPAHREYVGLTDAVRENRAKLDSCMIEAAESLDVPLLPLPEEWWDFRLPLAFTQRFAPLSDADLPPQMRCM